MEYKVTKDFTDTSDSGRAYKKGNKYPVGHKPTKARIEALLSGKNKAKVVLIEEVEQPKEEPKKKKTKGSK